ncbi:dihydrodipicolinate reductase [Frankia sp. CNm7]|uniref:Dihydrodipicolinate reductase n=1 Tax=Frankia nepalensis TaxID=1836974 RepID=A0A937R7T2_9ACTN|nr:dihydrodipicolinate reductase [Frankia nepalensis]MBL7500410.1 dihydrodipicolinate reductase [Frankia nepalensis]MBL7511103.1 dihydrodipicolinate reductase [Frankia nepalensis]MBL7519769.1 dihydrodipicolinate reductase [Frankia nepalensis]MBL7626931.1 dihydrodipicolinate reductase [Frankia nepalensis]
MTLTERPLRIVQWTTGKIASEAVRGIVERPELELVGAFAFSKEKVGQDVGELVGLGRTLGATATDDIEAIIALKPDCVVYMPLYPDVDHLTQLLRAGINVVSTAGFITGRAYGAEARAALDEAARAGGASLFGSGINPGFADYIATVASGPCREVNYVSVTESFNIGLWAADANQDELGWGRPAGDPGHAEDIQKATAVFGDAVEAIAHQLGLPLDDIRCEVGFAHAATDADVPGRSVPAGTVAGIDVRWIGADAGVDVVEAHVRWTVAADLDPAWDVAMAYLIEIRGTPQINLRIDVLPADIATFTLDDASAMGSMITAMPAVNAIPAVVAARPGIVTYADLPTVASRLRPKR